MKRKFVEIRKKILRSLRKKPMNRMEISRVIKADYRTVGRHLIWLLGTEKIKKVKINGKIVYRSK